MRAQCKQVHDWAKVGNGGCRDGRGGALSTLLVRVLARRYECEALCVGSPACVGFEWVDRRGKEGKLCQLQGGADIAGVERSAGLKKLAQCWVKPC